MNNVVLSAKNRVEKGSAESRRLRRSGRIPAVLYGRTGKAISLDLDALEFARNTKNISESTIVKVDVEGKEYDAFVKDTQRNIIDGKILHIDFYEVESGVILRARVPIQVSGNPIGVREGGSFENPLHDVEVECLPQDLPPRIIVDVSGLRAGESIFVRDIPIAPGVKILSSVDQMVAQVRTARVQLVTETEGEAEAEAEGEAAAAEEKDT